MLFNVSSTNKQIGSILNLLAGKFPEDTKTKRKSMETVAVHDWLKLSYSQRWLSTNYNKM